MGSVVKIARVAKTSPTRERPVVGRATGEARGCRRARAGRASLRAGWGIFNHKYIYTPTRTDGNVIVVLARIAGTSATREGSVVGR